MNNCFTDKIIAQTNFLGASVSSFHSNLGWTGQSSQLTVNLVTDESPAIAPGDPLTGSTSCSGLVQFQTPTSSFADNHYYDCTGNSCYVDKDGSTWDDARVGQQRADGSIIKIDDKIVPGKVYYTISSSASNISHPVVSKYLYGQDPGFLGSPNFIDINGGITTTKNIGYDIIGTPVYFKMGNFTFGGVVQSWQEDFSSGGKQYRVTIDGMQSVLSNCYIIISQYGGCIFSKVSGENYGSPRNYVSYHNSLEYKGYIRQGNIANVFNVYGFLESTAPENFGGANCNEDGMSAVDIIDALSVLTGRVGGNLLSDRAGMQVDFGPKTAYSPFGRILTKCMQTYDYTKISNSFNSWGVIPPQQNQEDTSSSRCEFLLDLSELPRPAPEFRIKGVKISITEFLNLVTEATGHDYSLELIPVIYNSKICNVIKVKAISRLKQPVPNQIQSTVNKLYCDGYYISSSTIGKERNDSPARLMIIGGPQQRLYQAKSYRLAYTQSNYIYIDNKFVDYLRLGHLEATTDCATNGSITRRSSSTSNFTYGKVRFPAFLSTRNPAVSSAVNPKLADIFQRDDDIKSSVTGATFDDTDSVWNDNDQITNGGSNITVGNYGSALKSTYTIDGNWGINRSRDSSVSTRDTPYAKNRKPHLQRYIPLYRDIICPFFGYIMDNSLSVDTGGSTLNSRDFRRVRPVILDTWTGQICIVMKASEIPATRLQLNGLYGGYSLSDRAPSRTWTWRRSPSTSPTPSSTPQPSQGLPPSPPPPTPTPSTSPGNINTTTTIYGDWYFLITESEIRAAMAGKDNFLAYSLGKSYKTDLYVMMNSAFYAKQYNLYISKGLTSAEASTLASQESDWAWRFGANNVATPVLSPTTTTPGRPPGGGVITEEVRQDFEVLQGFIAKIGESYYGKKYMVYAPFLGARKDEFYDRTITTSFGSAYVFRGGSKLEYNYKPTNDGAWEEPGNIIDDTIPVGGQDSYNLSDERGMIKPILGYNADDSFDYPRYNLCQKSITQKDIVQKANPFFTYNAWHKIKVSKARTCDPADFKFSTLNFSSLNDPSSYVIKTLTTDSKDAFGLSRGFKRKKLYTKANVQEKIIFLDPEQLTEPRIIIEAPSAIELSSTSLQYQKDPNRTVKATMYIEDLAIYLRVNDPSNWDCHFIRSLLHGVQDVCAEYEGYLFGNLSSVSHNTNAQNMDLRPKVAQPFFAAIPLKSSQYNYGPWINYPALDIVDDDIFPSFTKYEKNTSSNTVTCSTSTVTTTASQAKEAIDNWILPTNIEYNPDYVPWNYGGMSYLDALAYKEVKSNINYQSVLETASVEMVGLPIFNIGGAFNHQTLNNVTPISSPTTTRISYTETKKTTNIFVNRPLKDFKDLSATNDLTIVNGNLNYDIIKLPYISNYTNGPIISYINVDVGRNGIKTTYSFRTYTRKLSLFNKENQDRFKKLYKENLYRDKQLNKLQQQLDNKAVNELKTLSSQPRMNETSVSNIVARSPVEVITAIASPFLKEPVRSKPYIGAKESETTPGETSSATYSLPIGDDLGNEDIANNAFTTTNYQIASLKNRARVSTSAQIFQVTELHDFITQDYGSKAAMSLDGIFSPVSFYPTNNLGTFSFSKYDSATCPVCTGSRIRTIEYRKFPTDSVTENSGTYTVLCDCCTNISEKLHSKLYSKNGSYKNSSETIPPYILTDKSDLDTLSSIGLMTSFNKNGGLLQDINLISLQPIVVPYSEFKNPHVQNYTGAHPDGAHETLQINSQDRRFIDRSRHSISIVARSAIKQNPDLHLTNRIDNEETLITYKDKKYNPDFFYKDLEAINKLKKIDSTNYSAVDSEMNQRFIGLRGPMVLHAWGYDKDGYPVPNAADEPLEIDEWGRPKRFQETRTEATEPVEYQTLAVGDIFRLYYAPPPSDGPAEPGPNDPPLPPPPPQDTNEYIKAKNLNIQNTVGYGPPSTTITKTTEVLKITYKDDLSNQGGFDPATYKGSIISKTQKYSNGYWTSKTKLNEFYLNWAEHPEVWPVGPIDLRWDEYRKVWTANRDPIYKLVYVTLEEDLIKPDDLDETYPSRGFLDDMEYSTLPLDSGYRRVVFVKDRAGYTAPRGAKILCRYDADTGFYEPVSKPSFIVMGTLNVGGSATITMSYVLGKKKGENAPTMEISFDNPLDFNIGIEGAKGLFTFVSGKWILSAIK